jgi:hypothetical protein
MICADFLFLSPLVLACSYLLLQRQFRFSPRTASDAIAIVRCVEVRELEDLFDETKEGNLCARTTRFHEAQRARARLLFEYLRRMGFNAMALLVWAYAEQARIQGPGMPRDQVQDRNIREVIESGTDLRLYFAVAVFKLSALLLLDELRIVRIRKLSRLRRVAGLDGLDSYRRVTRAAVALCAAQNGAGGARLAALLGGSGLDH